MKSTQMMTFNHLNRYVHAYYKCALPWCNHKHNYLKASAVCLSVHILDVLVTVFLYVLVRSLVLCAIMKYDCAEVVCSVV